MENNLRDIIYFNRRKILVVITLIIILICGVIYYFYDDITNYDSNVKKDENKEEVIDSKNTVLSKEEAPVKDAEVVVEKCYFDIKGEVKKPGVYAIECDKRVIDAITLAGGLTKDADTTVLNMSIKISDGMAIIVYGKKEVASYVDTLAREKEKMTICESGNIVNGACIKAENKDSENTNKKLININTATQEELMSLTGIGEAKAKNIISYREKTPFVKKEDLLNVEGIGDSLYATIKENITV